MTAQEQRLSYIDGQAARRERDSPAFAARVEALETQIRSAGAMLAQIRGPSHAWRHLYTVADEVVEKAKRDGLL